MKSLLAQASDLDSEVLRKAVAAYKEKAQEDYDDSVKFADALSMLADSGDIDDKLADVLVFAGVKGNEASDSEIKETATVVDVTTGADSTADTAEKTESKVL